MLNLIKFTMEEPFVPFTKPYGMSDEQFEEEVKIAQDLHDLWLYKQSFEPQQSEEDIWIDIMVEEDQKHEEDLWYESLKEEMEQTSYKNWYV